ncbi:MAG: anhydro-N-acetylmuramic acid kinase, partial [Pseudomonadota bacterium]
MIDGRSSTRGTQVRVIEDGRPVWAMGMMSGTSMDGLDLAFMSTDGHRIDQFGPSWSMAHWPGLRTEIEAALSKVAELPTEALRNRDTWPDFLRELQHRVSLQTGWAIEGFQRDEGLDAPGRDSLWAQLRNEGLPVPMGIHGQTILHRPDERFTLQLFDPNLLSAGLVATEIMSDFRIADLKAGGEGAPLAPFFHFALAKHVGADTPLAFLNIGGVGNVTW